MRDFRLSARFQLCLALLTGLCMGVLLNFQWLPPGAIPDAPEQSTATEEARTIILTPTIYEMASPSVTGTDSPTLTPTMTPTPAPFTTLPGVWVVHLQLGASEAPQVLALQFLPRGRLLASPPGEGKVQILDERQNVLYEQQFEVLFFSGEPLQKVDTIEMLLMLPVIENAHRLHFSVPQGEVYYELPEVE